MELPDIAQHPEACAFEPCPEPDLRTSCATGFVAMSIALMVLLQFPQAVAGEAAADGLRGFYVAQAPMGSHEQYNPPLPQPKMEPLPSPSLGPGQPAPGPPDQPPEDSWGAIGFTADGSYSTIWKSPSKAVAEAEVAKKCAAFGRGGCQVVSFSGRQCGALATFIGNYKRRRWLLSFTAGGETYPEAQSAALDRCNSDERSQGRCTSRIAACADGR